MRFPKALRRAYDLGTHFLVYAKVTDREGGNEFVHTNHAWDVKVLATTVHHEDQNVSDILQSDCLHYRTPVDCLIHRVPEAGTSYSRWASPPDICVYLDRQERLGRLLGIGVKRTVQFWHPTQQIFQTDSVGHKDGVPRYKCRF